MRSGNLCKVPALKSESSGGKQGARKSDSSENNAFLTGLHDGDRCGNWLGYSCVVALNASAVTLVFRVTFPELVTRGALYDVAGWTIYLPEVAICSLFIILFAWLNTKGAALSGQFQFFAVVLMIVAVVVIVASMVIYNIAERPELAPAFPVDVSPVAAIATIIAFASWAYVGFDSIPQLAGEFSFSPKKALGLLMWGVIAATLIYLAMMLATSIAVGTHHGAYEGEAWPPAAAISEVMGRQVWYSWSWLSVLAS